MKSCPTIFLIDPSEVYSISSLFFDRVTRVKIRQFLLLNANKLLKNWSFNDE